MSSGNLLTWSRFQLLRFHSYVMPATASTWWSLPSSRSNRSRSSCTRFTNSEPLTMASPSVLRPSYTVRGKYESTPLRS